ncbi:MAG TPA: SMP-30/gluconolactonase/LRE family protein [Actinomycetota bacterium]|jgi:gluconolactonase
MNRRPHLTMLLMLLLMACDANSPEGGSPTVTTEPTPTVLSNPLDGRGDIEVVQSRRRFLQLEGPQWVPSEGVLLFSDIAADTIYQLGADDEITVFRTPSHFSNGLALDPQGRLIAAESSTRRVTRTDGDGTVTPIAKRFEGARLNQPNDIAVRSDGTIYFTDPLFARPSQAELDFRGVFAIAPNGALTVEYRGEPSEAPNGIALSPDESLLYVGDFAAGLVRVFDVASDGSLSEARTFVTVAEPDGIAIDDAGNLFVASFFAGAVEVFAPDGEHWGTIDVREPTSNCAFGGADGRTLYITTGTALYRVTLANPGPH